MDKTYKTYSVFVHFDAPTLEKLITLNCALVQLWNRVKALIDDRLSKQSEIKEYNTMRKKAIKYLDRFLKGESLQEAQRTYFAGGKVSNEAYLRHDQEALKQIGISPISINSVLPQIRADLKEEGFPLTSDLARQLVVKLCGSYSSFFELKKNKDPRARIPKQKDVEKNDWVIMSWSVFKVTGDILKLSLANGQKLEIVIPQNLLDRIGTQKPSYVFLTKVPQDDRWKLDIVVSYEAPVPTPTPTRFRAIDLGAGNVAVTDSDGTQYLVPTRRSEKYWMERICSVEKRMESRTKGSRGYMSLAKARRRMHNKANTQHKDHQRKLAHALSQGVDCVVVGKPRTRLGLARSKKLSPEQHHGVQNTGYMSRLMIFIKEKCVERGIQYVELPDPPRVGKLTDPQAKFEASRKLLEDVLKNHQIEMPTQFICRGFHFNQGGKKERKK